MRGLIRCLLEAVAKKRVLKNSRSQIDPSARVKYSGIKTTNGCSIEIGLGSIFDGLISFDRENARVRIGQRTFIGQAHIVAAELIEIGNDVMISWGATIVDHNSHALNARDRLRDVVAWGAGEKDWSNVMISPVKINDNAWIGFNAIILRGVSIGRGAIVAAGSVVKDDVPDYAVVMGNPARIIQSTEPL